MVFSSQQLPLGNKSDDKKSRNSEPGPLEPPKIGQRRGSKSAGNSPACSPVTDKKLFLPATLTNNVKTRSQSIAVGSSPETPNLDSPLSSPLKSNPEAIISVVGERIQGVKNGKPQKLRKNNSALVVSHLLAHSGCFL